MAFRLRIRSTTDVIRPSKTLVKPATVPRTKAGAVACDITRERSSASGTRFMSDCPPRKAVQVASASITSSSNGARRDHPWRGSRADRHDCLDRAERFREELDIPTVQGRAWFAIFRFYGPLEPYFDKSWPLPEWVPRRALWVLPGQVGNSRVTDSRMPQAGAPTGCTAVYFPDSPTLVPVIAGVSQLLKLGSQPIEELRQSFDPLAVRRGWQIERGGTGKREDSRPLGQLPFRLDLGRAVQSPVELRADEAASSSP